MLLHGYNEFFTGFQEYDYTYYTGTNRLKNTDGSPNAHYDYDAAGNVVANSERGITSITYDHRNLAQEVFTGTGSHRYVYDHTGTRVGKQYKATGTSNWAVNTRYVYGAYGELLAQYNGLVLQYWNILTPAGEALGHHLGSTFDTSYRRYYLKDHLGSVRVTVTDEGTAIGWDDYFPFGLQMPGRSYNQGNAFDDQKFTGHFLEQEGGLGIYHVVARMYDTETGRFWGVDAMRVKYPGISSYVYVANNPILRIDPDGRDWYRHDETGAVKWREGSNTIDGYSNIGANYTQDIGGGVSISYSQNEVSSITTTVLNGNQFVSMFNSDGSRRTNANGSNVNCYQAADETLANAGVQTAGRATEVLMTGATVQGTAGATSANAATGVNVINSAIDAGNPIIVGVDYRNGSPNHDRMTDHFIVISGRTETLNNGAVTSTNYNFFDNRTRHQNIGTQAGNTLNLNNNRLTGTYEQGRTIHNYTVTTVRRNQ